MIDDLENKPEKGINNPFTQKILGMMDTMPLSQVYLEVNRKFIDEQVFEAFYNFDSEIENYLEIKEPKVLMKYSNVVEEAVSRGEVVKIPEHFLLHASDCLVLLGEYKRAINILPKPELKQRSSFLADRIFSLRYYTETAFESRELLMLLGPKVTKLCIDYLEDIINYIDNSHPINEERINQIKDWAGASTHQKYPIFNATQFVYDATKLSPIEYFRFSENLVVQKYIKDLTREAENAIREDLGYPRVGEGWVSEMMLFDIIKGKFSDALHHYSPEWLKPQHFDVYIPSLRVAFEFQGKQHYEPVGFFGFKDGYKANLERDERKKNKSTKNHVKIVYWKYDEPITTNNLEVKLAKLKISFPN